MFALRRHFLNAQPPLSVAGRAPHARLPPAEYPVKSKVMTTTLTGREYWNFPKLLEMNIFLPEERGKGGGGARAMCSLCAGIF